MLNNEIAVATLADLHPTAARTATGNGTGLDVLDYEGNVALILDSAAGTGTTPTLDVKIQDSADNATFADLSPSVAFTQVVAAASRQKLTLNVNSVRRYIRIVYTIGGTTPSFTFSANLLGRKKYA